MQFDPIAGRTERRLRAFLLETTGPRPMLKTPTLLAALVVVCVASSADARRRHHGYYGERYSIPSDTDDWQRGREARDRGEDGSRDRDYRRRPRSLDEWRRGREAEGQAQDRGQAQGQDRGQDAGQDRARATDDWRRGRRDRDEWTRWRETERQNAVLGRARNGPFGAVVEKLIRGCGRLGAEFENLPFDAIARIAGIDDTQRNALAALRGAAKEAAERLVADCPQDIPAAPSARLEAVEQGIDAALKAFDTVQPALQTFYGALDDEQKARLYRDMAAPAAGHAPQMSGRRDPREYRRHRWRAYASKDRSSAAPGSSEVCEQFVAVLHGWPVREIERDVRLSGPQRVALYELVTSSLKAADTLGRACPAETALTPVGRMATLRARLAAVRAATAAIRPALMHFYEALDQGQKMRFAGMS
jgi:LTXXQ motif family protein